MTQADAAAIAEHLKLEHDPVAALVRLGIVTEADIARYLTGRALDADSATPD